MNHYDALLANVSLACEASSTKKSITHMSSAYWSSMVCNCKEHPSLIMLMMGAHRIHQDGRVWMVSIAV